MGSLASNGEGERSSSKRKNLRSKMCVRYTLLIANSLLALLGLLLLAGGVWRIVDDESLREVAKDIQDTQEWDDVKEEVSGGSWTMKVSGKWQRTSKTLRSGTT